MVFPFIEKGLIRFEQDMLLSETGHLLGRAWGKIAGGYATIKKLQGHLTVPQDCVESFHGALWAIEDGTKRLDLIKQNFYTYGVEPKQDTALSTGIDPNKVEYFDSLGLLKGMLPYFARLALEGGLRDINCKFTDDAMFVAGPDGTKDALALVYFNLLDNAIKFAYKRTYITLTAYKESPWCCFTFCNLGTGVAQDEFKTVFERLTKSRFQDTKRRTEGLGLGLCFCKRVICDRLGGTIELDSRPGGDKAIREEGYNFLTTITIRMPMATPPNPS